MREWLPSFGLVLLACGAPEGAGSSGSAIVNGQPSGSGDDEVVLILAHDASKDTAQGQYYETCTGTLLAPNVVLTARHCISETPDATFQCAEDGTIQSGTGGTIGADFKPSETYVYVGSTLPATLDPTTFPGVAGAFVHDASTVLCNHDVALIVLAQPIADAKIAPIRLDAPVTIGESLSVVGWGATVTTTLPSQRQRRDGVSVVDVGPSATERIGGQLADQEFLATESVCFGDSGGPAFDATSGAVVGVVSRGSNGGITSKGSGCVGTQHTFSQTAGFEALVTQAFAQAGGAPWIEGQPAPGTAPDAGADAGDDAGTAPSDGGGCAVGGSSSASPSWLLAVALAWLARSRAVRRLRAGAAKRSRSA